MLFPLIYIIFSVFVIFFRRKIERILAQRIVLGVMFVVTWLVLAIFFEAGRIGWHGDRVILLLASIWFLFCGFLLALPVLNLQRWVSLNLIFILRAYLVVFCWIMLILSFASMGVSLIT